MKKHLSNIGELARNVVLMFGLGLSVGLTSGVASHIGHEGETVNAPALSAEELLLAEELEFETTITIESVLAGLEKALENIMVYDLAGNLLFSQEGTIDLSQLPANAVRIMTDGATDYYCVIP